MTNAVEVYELEKHFNVGTTVVRAVDGITLNVSNGDFVSIMGPSGSGKSTLLYLIGGLDSPTKGSVKIGGKEICYSNDKKASKVRRQKIGFIFQFYNLVHNLSVVENVLLPLLIDGQNVSDHIDRAKDLLSQVGLGDKLNVTPRELSGGQQQRVAIARALINNPEFILADEPIGNLDYKTGVEIMNILRKLNEKGTTIIQVTHSIESSRYGKTLINIRDGKIVDSSKIT